MPCPRTILFFTFALALGSFPVVAATPNGCTSFIRPQVVVRKIAQMPKIDASKSLAEIRAIAATNNPNLAVSTRETPVGLTAATMKIETSFQVTSKSSTILQAICGQITKVEMTFGFDDTTIYMPREISSGSCAYNQVLEHENKHVTVDRMIVESYAPYVQNELNRIVQAIGVVRGQNPYDVESMLRQTLNKKVEEIGQYLTAQRSEAQDRVDTPQEYERLSKSCGGDISGIVAQERKQGRI
ncbi:MAG: hypothetical protein EOM37_07515 [Proteobacteria bacterium]|nr:hypothetical protein [Pseudomonadota bacterium]